MFTRLQNSPIGLILLIGTLLLLTADRQALAGYKLGPRAGLGEGNNLFVGGQGEFGSIFGTATFAPSLDLTVGGTGAIEANFDLRWYLMTLPETGLRFYGAAGPTLMLSPESELGLSLTLGMRIPMKNQRHYNLEFRLGFGDIHSHKLALAIMFRI